jgi:hypothetical protein
MVHLRVHEHEISEETESCNSQKDQKATCKINDQSGTNDSTKGDQDTADKSENCKTEDKSIVS